MAATPGMTQDGWFMEKSTMWPGQAQSIKVDKVLLSEQTNFQQLTIFESDPKGPWGTVMVLDGAIQLTDYDEFVYHEMLAHTSLCAHKNPKQVLIIGGGDGGVLREVLRHEEVENCTLVDIDGGVIEGSKKFFPQIGCCLEGHPKAIVLVDDGAAFLQKANDESYDVIICDSSDPEGPASVLFGEEFYSNIKRTLRPGGIICSQGESIWLHKPLIEKMTKFLRTDIGFASVRYGMIYIPTYPCGSIGALMAAKDDSVNLREPQRPVENMPFHSQLKYYTSDIHRSAFVLPRFAANLNQQ